MVSTCPSAETAAMSRSPRARAWVSIRCSRHSLTAAASMVRPTGEGDALPQRDAPGQVVHPLCNFRPARAPAPWRPSSGTAFRPRRNGCRPSRNRRCAGRCPAPSFSRVEGGVAQHKGLGRGRLTGATTCRLCRPPQPASSAAARPGETARKVFHWRNLLGENCGVCAGDEADGAALTQRRNAADSRFSGFAARLPYIVGRAFTPAGGPCGDPEGY